MTRYGRIRCCHVFGHYGDYHDLFDTYKGLYELRFKSPPIRIYFTVEELVLLWGGSYDKGNGFYSQEADEIESLAPQKVDGSVAVLA
ncbi:hypothetical protein AGMMS49940_19420 [Spirochaetia bacterium]|nr:hypothetical protein AGMMS49940_19420 [Spirochaetia bacterium]